MMPMLISSCQGGPTRTEVAEAGVGAVKHCSLFYLLKNVQRQRRPETRQDIKDAGATCWGGGVSIDCSHMLHLKRLGEAKDYPGLEDGLIIARKTLTQLLDIASLTEDKKLWSAVDIQGC